MMMKRLPVSRTLLIAAACLALFVTLTLFNWVTPIEAKKITLVYVGAENCGPCDSWHRDQGAAFRNSREFQRLAYREVRSPNLFDVLKDNYWPEDLRPYRQAIDRTAGIPLWLVIADDELILQRSGLTQWQESVLPKIKSLTKTVR